MYNDRRIKCGCIVDHISNEKTAISILETGISPEKDYHKRLTFHKNIELINRSRRYLQEPTFPKGILDLQLSEEKRATVPTIETGIIPEMSKNKLKGFQTTIRKWNRWRRSVLNYPMSY